VNINSLALATPINLDRFYVPPAPGMIPKAVSTNPKTDYSVATLISQLMANSNPPPNANPSI